MTQASTRSLAEEGTQIGAYQILRQIGQGGMGEVWLAEHTLLKRRAAIKLLRPGFAANEEMLTRFFNEARAAAAISDPGIVQIFDYGQRANGAYIVMELLEGEPLDKRLERVGAMAVADAVRTMRQVASSLGAAHARNIIHRDLKPENIFLVRDPEVAGGERAKLLDFGIAKLTDDQFAMKTQTSALLGTPTFMSPEQCRGASHVDARSDVYALGCVLFNLIVGAPPFDAANIGEMIAAHLLTAPPRPSTYVGETPPEIDELVLRCLAKDPAERFANGTELAAALDAASRRMSQPLPSADSAQRFALLRAPAEPGLATMAGIPPASAMKITPPRNITPVVPKATPMPVPPTLASTVPPTLASTVPPVAARLAATVMPQARGSESMPAVAAPAATADQPPGLPRETTLSRSIAALPSTTQAGKRIDPRILAILGGMLVVGVVGGFILMRSLGSSSEQTMASATPPPATSKVPAARGGDKAGATDRTVPSSAHPAEASMNDLKAGAAEARIAATLAGFQRWAARHAYDACPDAASLAKYVDGGVEDPWGRPLAVTCTDQPADQIIGVVSAGPDGVAGTRDDIASWRLEASVTDIVHGERWHPRRSASANASSAAPPARPKAPATPASPAQPTQPGKPKPGQTFEGTTLGNDGIPTTR